MPIWRNLRHSIEAFYDLYNLYNDYEYINVLEYSNFKKVSYINKKYKKYIHNGHASILSKAKIAKNIYNIDDDFFEKTTKIVRESNSYVHPNVFINLNEDINEKMKNILRIQIEILVEAYNMLCCAYNQGIQPTLDCFNCSNYYNKNCMNCFNNIFLKFKNDLNNLLIEPNINLNLYSYNI